MEDIVKIVDALYTYRAPDVLDEAAQTIIESWLDEMKERIQKDKEEKAARKALYDTAEELVRDYLLTHGESTIAQIYNGLRNTTGFPAEMSRARIMYALNNYWDSWVQVHVNGNKPRSYSIQ